METSVAGKKTDENEGTGLGAELDVRSLVHGDTEVVTDSRP